MVAMVDATVAIVAMVTMGNTMVDAMVDDLRQ